MPTLGEFFGDYLKYFFTNNVILLLVCVSMAVLLTANPMIGKKNVKPFMIVLVLLVVTALFDDVDHVLASYDTITEYCPVQTARLVFATITYSIKPAIPFAILYVVGSRKSKLHYLYWIPQAICCAVYLVNAFLPHDVAFVYYNELNNFVGGGPLAGFKLTNVVTAAFYIVCILIYCGRTFKHRTIGEIFVIIFSALACFAGHTIESFLTIYDLGNQATAVAVMFFFLFLLIKYTNVDPLTNVYNRQYFFSTTRTKQIVTGVISIDVNDLKTINDKYGHIKGDEALITISDKLLTVMSRKVMVFRMGGDEFVITCAGLDAQQVQSLVHLVDRMINTNTEYNAAIGYACREAMENRDTLLMKADAMMYERKAKMKELAKLTPVKKLNIDVDLVNNK